MCLHKLTIVVTLMEYNDKLNKSSTVVNNCTCSASLYISLFYFYSTEYNIAGDNYITRYILVNLT